VPGYGQIDHDYGVKLATTPPEADGPVWMVNLMRYRERAEYADGRETTLTGREADFLQPQVPGRKGYHLQESDGQRLQVINFGIAWEDFDGYELHYTLAVALGRPALRYLYGLLLGLPLLFTLPLYQQGLTGSWIVLPWLSLPPALFLVMRLWRAPVDRALNVLLARTAQWQLLYGLLLSLSLVL